MTKPVYEIDKLKELIRIAKKLLKEHSQVAGTPHEFLSNEEYDWFKETEQYDEKRN